jgi:hypothetical protein
MIPIGPIGISVHNYGPTARIFCPERWLTGKGADAADLTSLDTAGEGMPGAATGEDQLPDPLSFSTGPRDCVGQALAKMELQVVVASLVAKFELKPGAALQRAVDQQLAAVSSSKAAAGAAGGSGVQGGGLTIEQERAAAAVRGIYDMAHYHITFQPKDGLYLKATPRTV